MSFNIKTIVKAWGISFNPSNQQKALAERRAEICLTCPAKTKIGVMQLCSECGCPISKKVFTDEVNPCPLGKWTFDEEYLDKKLKVKKTLI